MNDFQLAQKAIEEIHERADAKIKQRLVGTAEADLIKRDDAKFCGQRRDYRIPNPCVVCQTVNQNQWSAAPCFDIMNPRAIDRDGLVDFGRCFPLFLRRRMPWA